MSRDNFFFKDSSRIYRQANELAKFLRQGIRDGDEWFSDVTKLLALNGLDSLGNDEERKRAVELAWEHAKSIAGTIDPRIAIPALLESVDDFYYRDTSWKQEVPICGSALKSSIAMIWPNIQSQFAVDKSADRLLKLVYAVMAWEQLVGNEEHCSVFGFGPVTLNSTGFSYSSERDETLMAQWNEMASPYGAAQRTLEHSKQVIFRDPHAFSEAVTRVLNGERSSTIELFRDTLFASVGENPDFWLGLRSRVTLLAFAARFKLAGAQDFSGVVLFEEFAAELQVGPHAASAKLSTEACFWKVDWYNNRVKGSPANMLVERPVLRIDKTTFATSVLTIMDSINCFVENSVFSNVGYGGATVKSDAFQLHFSRPFEQEAVDLFLEAGWKASGVSDTGYWAAGNCQLVRPGGGEVPGEIDVLALHPSGLYALVVECKVLTQPFSRSKLTNVVGKLGPDDQAGFHSNLERKVNWLAKESVLQGTDVVGALLVDQGSFLGEGAVNPVMDLEGLHALLTYLNKNIDSDTATSARS